LNITRNPRDLRTRRGYDGRRLDRVSGSRPDASMRSGKSSGGLCTASHAGRPDKAGTANLPMDLAAPTARTFYRVFITGKHELLKTTLTTIALKFINWHRVLLSKASETSFFIGLQARGVLTPIFFTRIDFRERSTIETSSL